MHPVPPIASFIFLAIVGILVVQVFRWQRALHGSVAIPLAVLGWLAVTAVLALNGFFEDFSTIPPRVAFAVAPPFLAVIFAAWKAPNELLAAPPRIFVTYQGFRVLMEVVLFMLYYVGVLPQQMTWEGRNFDVVVGITAPIVAWFCLRSGRTMRGPMIAWNMVSMILLANIMIVGLLSAPTPFRMFTEGPANRVVALWPWIWLPSFVVPMALAGHLFSLRQLLQMRTAGSTTKTASDLPLTHH